MSFSIPICRAYIGRRSERNQVVSCALIKTLLLDISVFGSSDFRTKLFLRKSPKPAASALAVSEYKNSMFGIYKRQILYNTAESEKKRNYN